MKFMENIGMDSKNCNWDLSNGPREGCKNEEKPWKKRRAQFVSCDQNTLEATAGETIKATFEVKNASNWPWKQGCFIGMADSCDAESLPCEAVY